MTADQVRDIKRRHSAALLSQPGICGVGVEKDEAGEHVLAIHVDAGHPEALKAVPERIEGCPTKVIASGPFRKFSKRSEG
jgi:hypothetical protein